MNTKNNTLLVIILAIAIFIPSVVAIVSYSTSDERSISANVAESLVICDLNAQQFSFEKSAEGDNKIMSVFSAILEGSEQVSALPDALSGTPFYKVTFTADKIETVYQFYFAVDGTDTYYVTAEGGAYRVGADKVKDFLASEVAQSFYDSSKIPSLLLSGEYKLAPVTEGNEKSSWMYKNTDGTFVSSAFPSLKNEPLYELEGGLALAFSEEPDKFNVKVTNPGGEEFYNDQYSNIGSLKIPEGTSVVVSVRADWFEDKDRDYYGTLSYSFDATMSAPAVFYPGVTFADQGGFISVTATNVKNAEKITFESAPDIGFTPKWFADGEVYRTLIPFSADLAQGNYELKFSYAGLTKTVNVDLKDAGYTIRTYAVNDAVLAKAYSDEALAAYKNGLSSLVNETSDKALWEGAFLSAPAQSQISMGYGHTLNIEGKNVSVRHEGVDYRCGEGTRVNAINSGKVVFVGEFDYTGRIVVIDHGLGLKTWYSHLSASSVNVGDEVKKGDKIGEAGSTGFTKESGVDVSMTVFGKTVLPYSTWDDNYDYPNAGIEMGIPMYNVK